VTRSSGAWVAAPALRLAEACAARCSCIVPVGHAMCPSILSCGLGLLQGATGSPRPPPRAPLMGFRPLQHRRYRGYSSRFHARGSPTCTVSTVCAGLLPRRLPGPISSRERSWGCPGRASPRRHRRRLITDGKSRRVRSRHARGWLARRPFPPIVSSLGACRPSVMRLDAQLSCACRGGALLRVRRRDALQSLLHRRWSRSLWRARSPFEVPRHRRLLAAHRLRRGSSSYRPTRRTIVQRIDQRQARRELSTIEAPPYSSRDSPACRPPQAIPIFFTPESTACG
jgi:hypothetical protein